MCKDCVITLHWSEIVYDVEMTSWRVAKTHFADSPKGVAESTLTEEMMSWTERKLKSCLSEVRRSLAFAVTDKSVHSGSDYIGERRCDEQEYILQFCFPEGWRGSGDVLADLIHDYAVNRIITEWFTMVAPELASTYAIQAADTMGKIVSEARSEVIRTPRFVL